jgi:hypothetical protein
MLDAGQADTLYRTVETEIIPRLMLLHRQDSTPARPADAASQGRIALDDAQVVQFTDLILQGHEPALEQLGKLVGLGVTLDDLCLNLLAPCARRLGDLWNADLCDFTVVTVALGRLQALLRGLSSNMRLPRSSAVAGRTVLFAPVPGEQHTFGLSMVCDFFRTRLGRGARRPQTDAMIELRGSLVRRSRHRHRQRSQHPHAGRSDSPCPKNFEESHRARARRWTLDGGPAADRLPGGGRCHGGGCQTGYAHSREADDHARRGQVSTPRQDTRAGTLNASGDTSAARHFRQPRRSLEALDALGAASLIEASSDIALVSTAAV